MDWLHDLSYLFGGVFLANAELSNCARRSDERSGFLFFGGRPGSGAIR